MLDRAVNPDLAYASSYRGFTETIQYLVSRYQLGRPPLYALGFVTSFRRDPAHSCGEHQRHPAVTAASIGPADTSRFPTRSTFRFSPSSDRAPSRPRSPGSPNTTSSVVND